MHATPNFMVKRIRSIWMPKLQRMWFVARKVAVYKYGNGKRDTACLAVLGNGEMGQSRKGYSLT